MSFLVERIFRGPGFAETLYLGMSDGRRVIRKLLNEDARDFSRIALIREIRLLLNLPEELRPFFPEVIGTNLGDQAEDDPGFSAPIYYDMPYYPPEEGWVTLSDCLLDGTVSHDEARRVLGEIMDTAFRYFYLDEREPEPDYAEKTMLRALRESIAWARSNEDFTPVMNMKNLSISGKRIRNIPEPGVYLEDTSLMRRLLTPSRNRFLHGDFFPENILYNTGSGRWLLLDPVSVRGVHRGDFILDVNKMADWLSGELPALRSGYFMVTRQGNTVECMIHTDAGNLENLHRLGLSDWYTERLNDKRYARLFSSEPGWERRYMFVKAFYAFCMVPLADRRQAIARYLLGVQAMAAFLEGVELDC